MFIFHHFSHGFHQVFSIGDLQPDLVCAVGSDDGAHRVSTAHRHHAFRVFRRFQRRVLEETTWQMFPSAKEIFWGDFWWRGNPSAKHVKLVKWTFNSPNSLSWVRLLKLQETTVSCFSPHSSKWLSDCGFGIHLALSSPRLQSLRGVSARMPTTLSPCARPFLDGHVCGYLDVPRKTLNNLWSPSC